ncbi:Uncharacterized protein conserved in bacteria [Chlamydia abortus]|uniref:DUF5590 domain-containing protein n=1 Tax=Paenibacillus residui TaxID=629724 RepID=A0ABW3D7N1_9BACL|nr:hypothetical protein [Paenibacillus sp. 32O-W]SHE11499.1 Uncharacterized protein conserved in bacteria [Chlamydia abortus]
MKLKATLILLALFAGTTLIVFLLMYGTGNPNLRQNTARDLPSHDAARAYVLDHKLLASVDQIQALYPGGPAFLMLSGRDDNGQVKYVWVAGPDESIEVYGTALESEGVPETDIAEALKKKGIETDQIAEIYAVPRDYTSKKIVWYVREKGEKRHMLWYEYETGELYWEAYGEPTAWERDKAFQSFRKDG